MKKKLFIISVLLIITTGLFAASLGDVNNDGFIDIVDALQVAQYSVGLHPPGFNREAADVDVDTRITIADALIIAQYAVGIIRTLPQGNRGSGAISGTVGYLEKNETSTIFIPLPGTTITLGDNTVESGEDGHFNIRGPGGREGVINFMKEGYFSNYKPVTPVNDVTLNLERVHLLEMEKGWLSGLAGGSVKSSGDLCEVIFDPGTFVTSGGETYQGEVEVSVNTLLPREPDFLESFPGSFRGDTTLGEKVDMASYGVIAVEIYDNLGNELELGAGKSAEIRIKAPAPGKVPSSIPLWYLDEKSGNWIEEGRAELIGGEYIGRVSHFTRWSYSTFLTGETFRIEGRVVDDSGQAVPYARVKAFPAENTGNFYTRITGIEGRFSLEVYPTGPNSIYYLEAVMDSSESLIGVVSSEGNDVRDVILSLGVPGKRLDGYSGRNPRLSNNGEVIFKTGETRKIITLKNHAADPVRIRSLQLEGSGNFAIETSPSFPGDVNSTTSRHITISYSHSGSPETGQLIILTDCPYHSPALIINLAGGVELSPPRPTIPPVDYIIDFPDWGLEYAVRETIGKPVGNILKSDVMNITGFAPQDDGMQNFRDLRGMEHFESLTELDLAGNQISDLSPLSKLVNLTNLNLIGNEINDLSTLSNLINLTDLKLGTNYISDLSQLSNLVNLNRLILSANRLSDLNTFPLLANLRYLDLSYNQISDVSPLSKLTNLTGLDLRDNSDDIGVSPLLNLVNLADLDLALIKLSNFNDLSNMISLTRLNLSATGISDLSPLSKLINLTELILNNNSIVGVSPLSKLTNLTHLDLPYNDINNISAFAKLVNLTHLDLSYNDINDVSGLFDLVKLTDLSLWSNEISDISALSNMVNLIYLDLTNNQITGISALSNMINLRRLKLFVNQISDISALSKMRELRELILTNNQIVDVSSISNLLNLTDLRLGMNNISDICPLVTLENCRFLIISANPLDQKSRDECIPRLEAQGTEVWF